MMTRALFVFLVAAVASTLAAENYDRKVWNHKAQDYLLRTLQKKINNNVARNVILLVGDGMSLATIAAARVLKSQKAGGNGIGADMIYETFPSVGLAKTYATDKYVPDSASTATAFLCGVKTRYESVGVDYKVRHGDCSSVRGTELRCIAEWALAEGKSVGLVTNMRVTHATPAPLYSHSPDRWWEYDGKIPEKDRSLCKDIARQLVEDYPGRSIQVILGGGREVFTPNTTFDPECPNNQVDPECPKDRGKRIDNRNLIDYWKMQRERGKQSYRYVWNKRDFDKVDPKKVDYLLGLFGKAHLCDVIDRVQPNVNGCQEPTLAEMTSKAIAILSKNPKGYFLLVEGGLIDKRHHSGRAKRAVSEALDFEGAVQVAVGVTSSEDTLIVSTSDHSQGMMFAGYAAVGEDIFGVAEVTDEDSMPYTTLLYSTGPGYNRNFPSGRQNLTGIDTTDKDYLQQAAVPRRSVTHSGEDVAVYATGPMAHLFAGVYDQHYVAHAMAYASCMGSNKDHCQQLYTTAASAGHIGSPAGGFSVIVIAWVISVYCHTSG